MTEFISEFIKLFNKPIFLIAAGISIRLSAPENLVWSGWVFIALGIAGIVNKIIEIVWEEYFAYRWLIKKQKREKIEKYELLEQAEKDIVDFCIANETRAYAPKDTGEESLVESLFTKDFGFLEIMTEWEGGGIQYFTLNNDIYSQLLQARGEEIKAKYDQKNKRKK